MITEKGLRDHVWCQIMWKEPTGEGKRVKPERKYEDQTISLIHEALTTGKPNKKAIPAKIADGVLAEPYDGQFWIVVNTGNTSLLVTLNEVTLKKESNGPWTITATRSRGPQPSSKDMLTLEKMVRRVIAREFKVVVPNLKVVIQSTYDGTDEVFTITEPNPEQLREADNFFEEIRETAEGEKQLIANVSRCSVCWWKACPMREETGPTKSQGMVML